MIRNSVTFVAIFLLCSATAWRCGGSDAADPFISLDGVLHGWPDTWSQDAAFPDEVKIACESDDNCGPYYCDQAGICQECLITSHCPSGYKCDKNQCVMKEDGCIKDLDCAAGLICDKEKGECVFCLETTHCESGQYCLDGKCMPWVCDPGAKWCVGTVPFYCNEEGTESTEGEDCSDQDVCTEGDGCANGECKATTQTDCEDNNPCTDDFCDPVEGCYAQFNDDPCDDDNECTEGDRCDGGNCVSGETLTCDCAFDSDCAGYNDEDLCNGVLHCHEGFCIINPVTVVDCPESENQCLVTSCAPETGECNEGFVEDGEECDDGLDCTSDDQCLEGECVGELLACDDGNPCTDDTCDDEAGCVNEPADNDCDDGNACTSPDYCLEGVCVGDTLDCEDGNPCTSNSCLPADGCQSEVVEGACDDGDACTVDDVCDGAVCSGEPAVCEDDGNFCTNDYCDPELGCVNEPNDLPCDDDNPCTTGDTCTNAECLPGETLFDCNDYTPCTTDSCDVDSGECLYLNNSQPCDDGDKCTTSDQCANGECAPGPAVVCDDGNPCTSDYCDAQGECKSAPVDAACDDGNQCTLNDKCLGGACQPGTPLPCNDYNLCTDETCKPDQGCVYTFNSKSCNDGDMCTLEDQCTEGECLGQGELDCSDNNPCTDNSCNPASGCSIVSNSEACDDGDECTDGDYCAVGTCMPGGLVECDDGDVCTDDQCDSEAGCQFTNNDADCDDGNPCTFSDQCASGACVGGEETDCDDGNPCTEDVCGETVCLYAPVQGACDDGQPCTIDDTCTGGNCIGAQVDNCGCHSLQFDGVSGLATVPDSPQLDLAGAFTIECWWNVETTGNRVFLNRWDAPGSSEKAFQFKIKNDKTVEFKMKGAAGTEFKVGKKPADIIGWHHSAAVFDGAELRLYVDGELGDTKACDENLVASSLPLYLGGRLGTDGVMKDRMKGLLDEMRISSAALYDGQTIVPPKHMEVLASTVAYWGADQNQYQTLFDTSENNLHAELSGGTYWASDAAAEVCVPLPNYPPSNPEISVQPPNPVDADDLICVIEQASADMEFDPVSYQYKWYKDGVLQPALTGDTVDGDLTTPCPPWLCDQCEKWTCEVIPSDDNPGFGTEASVHIGLAECKTCSGTIWGTGCYKLYNQVNTWDAAKNTCGGWSGSHLVSISSAAENAFVAGLTPNNASWIGFNDKAVENTFAWANLEPVAYTNWHGGQPDNFQGKEDCVEILNTGKWNDLDCAALRLFVCEQEP